MAHVFITVLSLPYLEVGHKRKITALSPLGLKCDRLRIASGRPLAGC
jgi:hypothetical protein